MNRLRSWDVRQRAGQMPRPPLGVTAGRSLSQSQHVERDPERPIALEAESQSEPGPGHDFGQLPVHPAAQDTQACPLAMATPRACPFGGACHTCPVRVQAKREVSQPGDPDEQEADRVAAQIMRLADRNAPRPTDAVVRPESTLPNDDCQLLRRRTSGTSVLAALPTGAPPIVRDALRSPGHPLEDSIRNCMAARFCEDFSAVRVHTDALAATSARAIGAKAYTVGEHVVLGKGHDHPSSEQGRRLLAHELTHVLQQRGSHPGAYPLQRAEGDEESDAAESSATLSGCTDAQRTAIMNGIKEAKRLATRACTALERAIPLSYERSALKEHFGNATDEQLKTILERYRHIRDNVDAKTYRCAPKNKKSKKDGETVDLCGEAKCPGSDITLFPNFGSAGCASGATVLHEAVHNAGACGDVDQGRGYPPAKAENNAYSYEYFALAVAKGVPTPQLPERKPIVPEIPE